MGSASHQTGSLTDRHSRRVAWLAGQVAERMGVNNEVCDALERAALTHQKYRLPALRRQSVLPEPAGAILRLFAGNPESNEAGSVKAAAAILDVCHAFDEAVETAVYEGKPLADAFREFFSEPEPWRPCALSALRELVWPETPYAEPRVLPVLPSAASALLKTSPDTVSPAELGSIAERDPVLASRLLGLANSAALGTREEIRSLREAVLRIGVPLAHKALVTASIGPLFASSRLQALWKHSREVAALAHELALECGVDSHQAWLAGLLHDIGRLVFETAPGELCARERNSLRSGFPLTYTEMMIWGTDHATAGANVIARWKVPADLIEAVRSHAAPETTESPLAALLYLADTESGTRETEFAPDLAAGFRIAKALEASGLPASAISSIHREAPVFALAA